MAFFKYTPEWQGPLSGRSFERQTEDAINGLLEAIEEISVVTTQVATATQNGLMSKDDKVFLDGLKTSFPSLSNRVDALTSRIQIAEGAITLLQSSYASLTATVAALVPRVAALEDWQGMFRS